MDTTKTILAAALMAVAVGCGEPPEETPAGMSAPVLDRDWQIKLVGGDGQWSCVGAMTTTTHPGIDRVNLTGFASCAGLGLDAFPTFDGAPVGGYVTPARDFFIFISLPDGGIETTGTMAGDTIEDAPAAIGGKVAAFSAH